MGSHRVCWESDYVWVPCPPWANLVQWESLVCLLSPSFTTGKAGVWQWGGGGGQKNQVELIPKGNKGIDPKESLDLDTNLSSWWLNLDTRRYTSGVPHQRLSGWNPSWCRDHSPGSSHRWLRKSICQFAMPGMCSMDKKGTWHYAQVRGSSVSLRVGWLLVSPWWFLYITVVVLSNSTLTGSPQRRGSNAEGQAKSHKNSRMLIGFQASSDNQVLEDLHHL